MTNPSDRLMRTPEAAQFLGIGRSTLEKMRVYGGGPPFIVVGPRCVAYAPKDLTMWLDGRRCVSTSERPSAPVAVPRLVKRRQAAEAAPA